MGRHHLRDLAPFEDPDIADPLELPDEPDDELDAAEAARVARREREHAAGSRELMSTGSAKLFKAMVESRAYGGGPKRRGGGKKSR